MKNPQSTRINLISIFYFMKACALNVSLRSFSVGKGGTGKRRPMKMESKGKASTKKSIALCPLMKIHRLLDNRTDELVPCTSPRMKCCDKTCRLKENVFKEFLFIMKIMTCIFTLRSFSVTCRAYASENLDTLHRDKSSPRLRDNNGLIGIASNHMKMNQRMLLMNYDECHHPDFLIPENSKNGISDTIVVNSPNFLVQSMEVFVNISHSFRGDLRIELIHGSLTVELQKASTADSRLNILGTYPTSLLPYESLTVFNDTDAVGNWTLRISDHRPGYNGTLHGWCLVLHEGQIDLFGDISSWDTSRVTNMDDVFGFYNPNDFESVLYSWAEEFNDNISQWNTNEVTSMISMFDRATSFNGDLSKWNTSKVTSMDFMFFYSFFNTDISGWDTSRVRSMRRMFYGNQNFNGDVSQWNTSRVTSMNRMFALAYTFNQVLCWNVSNVDDFSDVFCSNNYASFNTSCINSNTTMTNDNIKSAAYLWVTNYKLAQAKYGDIVTWDTSGVTNMDDMFGYKNPYSWYVDFYISWASNFDADLSKWNTSKVTSMKGMFDGSASFSGGNLSQWNTTRVIDMGYMLYKAHSFDSDLSKWNTSRVTSMRYMFFGAHSFKSDISLWDTSRVSSMSNMFYGALSFKGELSTWDTSQVTDMTAMFKNSAVFNSDISKWDTYRVLSMLDMFNGAANFNQTLCWNVSNVIYIRRVLYGSQGSFNLSGFGLTPNNTITDSNIHSAAYVWVMSEWLAKAKYGDVASWDTSRVTNMDFVFGYSNPFHYGPDFFWQSWVSNFDADLSRWNTSLVTSMHGLFYEAFSFNGNVSQWDTGHVTDMSYAFYEATLFNSDLSKWKTSRVTSMEKMFHSAIEFNGNISTWETSAVTSMSQMFKFCFKFNNDISRWDTSRVQFMNELFFFANSFNQTLCWNVSNVINFEDIFSYSSGSFGATCLIASFNNQMTDDNIHSAVYLWFTENDLAKALFGDVELWDTSRVTSMDQLFRTASSFNADLSLWNTSQVTSMYYTFAEAFSFNGVITQWNTNSVTEISHLFFQAKAFNQSLCWNLSTVASADTLFFGSYGSFNRSCYTTNNTMTDDSIWSARSLSEIAVTRYGDVGLWDTSRVTDMAYLFAYDDNFNEDLSLWNTSKVTDMEGMFKLTYFNSDLSEWDTSRVTSMKSMFEQAYSFNGDISRWNISNCTDTSQMFYFAVEFNQTLLWDTNQITSMASMFENAVSFNGDISIWRTGSVEDISRMFSYATGFNQSLCWNLSSVVYADYLFSGSYGSFNRSCYTTNNTMTDDNIRSARSLSDIAVTRYGDVGLWDTSRVTDMAYLFANDYYFDEDLSFWNTSKVTDMEGMFSSTISFNCDLSK